MEWIMVDMYCTFFPNKEFNVVCFLRQRREMWLFIWLA